jgi:methylase of polypeptide subunit release factors
MDRLRTKVEKSLFAINGDRERKGRAFFQDATKVWPEEVDQLDAIITSPPFFDSTRFHTANWMRLWFAGWNAEEFQSEPSSFVDDRQKKSFEVYRPIFEQCAERLKPGGLVLIHLGKSVKCDMALALEKIAGDSLEHLDMFTESVEHCESHGIRDKGTVTHHQYLLLRRA